MTLEDLVSKMMNINVTARLWHWTTDVAQHHVTYEQFLTQNETLTDSLVESALGNDISLSFEKVGVREAVVGSYSLESARSELKSYRQSVSEMKGALEGSKQVGSDELITILDDVTELSSKTLYLLKLK